MSCELTKDLRILRELREIKRYIDEPKDPNAKPPEGRWKSRVY